MFRNEKTGRFESEKSSDNVTSEVSEFGYYSKKLNKPFDTVEELKAAEAEAERIESEKRQKIEQRKLEAKKVEDAFKALNAAKATYDAELKELKKAYIEAVQKAKDAYNTDVEIAFEKVNVAEKTYSEALDEFKKAHPEGYHLTLQDGDSNCTIVKSPSFDKTFNNLFNDIFDSFFNYF